MISFKNWAGIASSHVQFRPYRFWFSPQSTTQRSFKWENISQQLRSQRSGANNFETNQNNSSPTELRSYKYINVAGGFVDKSRKFGKNLKNCFWTITSLNEYPLYRETFQNVYRLFVTWIKYPLRQLNLMEKVYHSIWLNLPEYHCKWFCMSFNN